MSEYTSGEWEYDNTCNQLISRKGKYETVEIARVNWMMDGFGSNNGRLIAAAPDLLEACKKLLLQFETEIYGEYSGTNELENRLLEAEHARSAIAKATKC